MRSISFCLFFHPDVFLIFGSELLPPGTQLLSFHWHRRTCVLEICFLLFAILYIVSYFIITRYKRKSDEQEDEDAIVNRISLFLSTFTLAVSAGAVLLLPFSIISNEILLSFPQNYYIQWLNGSLIHVPAKGSTQHSCLPWTLRASLGLRITWPT
uniref:limb region 1 protein homolog isoform X1 n=1 Tax=Halichoerus grypus TaxID=9711 RepID=UPI001659AD5C|nr:limb region 1 protein homolog isoform X1 [Halichoerus grypus]